MPVPTFATIAAAGLIACGTVGCDSTRREPSAPRPTAAAAATSAVPKTSGSAGALRSAVDSTGSASSDTASSSSAERLGPLADTVVRLPLEGFPEAVVSLPTGAGDRRPIVIAAHGNYDRPEWQCQEARVIFGSRAFVLCPRGIPRPDSPSADDIRYTFRSDRTLQQQVVAGLKALRTRWSRHVADGPVLWTGFSLGAIMGARIAARSPAAFDRLVLTEGGHDAWTFARSAAFAKGGDKRVLFVCGQRSCSFAAKRAGKRLAAAGVAVKIETIAGIGHSYGGKLGARTASRLDWLLADDARWTKKPATP